MRRSVTGFALRPLWRLHSIRSAVNMPSVAVATPTTGSRRSSLEDEEDELKDLVSEYISNQPSPLTMQQLTDFGRKATEDQSFDFLVQSFNFLRKEMPTRLATTMQEIDHLPAQLVNTRAVSTVKNWYKQSFKDMMSFRTLKAGPAAAQWFTRVAAGIKQRHANVVETMAQGIIEMRERYGEDVVDTYRYKIQYFLDRFYMNRISMRLLLSQHVALFADEETGQSSHVGIIDPKCNVIAVIQDAASNARRLCETYYGDAPEIRYKAIGSPDDGMTVSYVPTHLFHIIFELLKNSCRAVVEHHRKADSLPAVEVMITKGEEDICIKVSDQGGGINRSALHKLFHYHYSTAPQPDASHAAMIAPLAGYGYGLPLSRVYAQYFTGDLVVTSMKGYGTDVHVYLKKLSSQAREVLPLYSPTTKKHYESPMHMPPDWSSTVAMNGGVSSRAFSTGLMNYG